MPDPPYALGAPSFRSASGERVGNHEPEPVSANAVSAFVLAGGQSRRMGQDKALLTLAGQPLIAHALSVLRAAGHSPVIAGSRSDLSRFAPVIPDSNPDLGPLAGICAALESTTARYSVFLPVDLPIIPRSLIAYLVHNAQITSAAVTIPSICGAANTFPVVLEQSVLPALKSALASGRRGCLAAFHDAARALSHPISVIPVEFLAQSGQAANPRGLPAALWFLNLNTPADIERVERHFPSQIA
jgi:molybdopterin-guanine dinucleotide biosynthesis protein A